MSRRVFVTTRIDDGRLRGIVRDAATREALDVTAPIAPPHVDVAKARAGELARERFPEWLLVDEPPEAP